MAFTIDWAAVWGGISAVGLSGLGLAASYGSLRTRVAAQDDRMDKQDEQITKLATAIEKATSVATEVALLRQSSEASHKLLLSKQEGAQELTATKFEGLAAELRSFMQGQASAGLVAAPVPRATRKTS